MFGSIMPAPLAMPPTRTGLPSTRIPAATLVHRVGGHDRPRRAGAAVVRQRRRPPRDALLDLVHRQRTPIVPVEQTQHFRSAHAQPPGRDAAMRSASIMPCGPLQAFALPLLTTIARASPPRPPSRGTGSRRALDAVGGKNAGHRRHAIGDEQRDIQLGAP